MTTELERFCANPANRLLYLQAKAGHEATNIICELMEAQGMTHADMARRLGVSRSNVSCFMASASPQLRNVVRYLDALGHGLTLSTYPLEGE